MDIGDAHSEAILHLRMRPKEFVNIARGFAANLRYGLASFHDRDARLFAALEDRESRPDGEGTILVKPMARIRHRSLTVGIEERRRLQVPMSRLLELVLVPFLTSANPINAHVSFS